MRNQWMGKKRIIFGVGDLGKELWQRMQKCGIEIECFCDNNEGLWGKTQEGKFIFSPLEAYAKNRESIFIITVFNHTEDVKKQLLDMGVLDENIYIWTSENYLDEADKENCEKKKHDKELWWQKKAKQLREFHNKYSKKRCFIIGNGGSLTTKDLENLEGEYTFGTNRLYKLYDKTSWRPTFYCFYDRLRAQLIANDFEKIADGCEYVFTSGDLVELFDEGILEHSKIRFLKIVKEKYYPNLPRFSNLADVCIYDGQTVLYVATQLAVYMGFEEIYYLGADNQYSVELNLDGSIKKNPDVKDYPKEMGNIDLATSVIPQMELTTMSFEATKQYAQESQLKVYNVTRGGKLDVFERKTLEEVLRE